jgi:hypothetical protein
MVNAAPTGYWIYQPANGYPVTNQNGMPVCIPVYGPPMNAYPGYAPPMTNGNPVPPPNLTPSPVQAGAYPMNYPPNSTPNYPATAPANMPINLPPTGSVGPAQGAPSFDSSHAGAALSPAANLPR